MANKIGNILNKGPLLIEKLLKKYLFYGFLTESYQFTPLGIFYLALSGNIVYRPASFLNFQKFLRLSKNITANKETELLVSLKKQGLTTNRKDNGPRSTQWSLNENLIQYQKFLLQHVKLSDTLNIDSNERNCINFSISFMKTDVNVFISDERLRKELFLSKREGFNIFQYITKDLGLAEYSDKDQSKINLTQTGYLYRI